MAAEVVPAAVPVARVALVVARVVPVELGCRKGSRCNRSRSRQLKSVPTTEGRLLARQARHTSCHRWRRKASNQWSGQASRRARTGPRRPSLGTCGKRGDDCCARLSVEQPCATQAVGGIEGRAWGGRSAP